MPDEGSSCEKECYSSSLILCGNSRDKDLYYVDFRMGRDAELPEYILLNCKTNEIRIVNV